MHPRRAPSLLVAFLALFLVPGVALAHGATPMAMPIPIDSQPPASPAASADLSSGPTGSGSVTDTLVPIAVAVLVVGGILMLLGRRGSA